MHPQLAAVAEEFREAQARLHRLLDRVPAADWPRRPHPDRWSVAECVEHLNLTSRAFLPLVDAGLAQARALGGPAPRRYRRDLLGWLLWRTMGPPVRMRVRTTAPFVPGAATQPPAAIVAEFDRLQAELLRRVDGADGLPLQEARVQSPFDPRGRASYNLFAALTILPRHQHRHLWQAEQALAARG